VRLDERHPIDMLGGGLCVAPPSVRPSGANYAWLRGGLRFIANGNLPKIRSGAIQKREPAGTGADVDIPLSDLSNAVPIGRRNDTLFRLALALAHDTGSQADLLEQARKANAELADPPLPDGEVQRAVASAWGYKMRDRLMVPSTDSAIILPAASIARLLAAGETDAMALLTLLRKAHAGLRDTFAASPEAMVRARLIGSWDKRRYRHAARRLCDLGELVQVHRGGKGARDPALYRFAEGGRFAPQY
jgi:Primase C terminal 1 (PriCT-1)